MNSKKILAGFLSAAMAFGNSGIQLYAADAQPSDYNSYEEIAFYDRSIGKYVFKDGTFFEPIRRESEHFHASVLPEKYDLRETFSSLSLNFPEIRDQNPTGTCWVHGTLAALETRGLMEGLFTNSMNVNFSEAQIAYFTVVSAPDPDDPYYGENFAICPDYNYSVFELYDTGGTPIMAAGSMARGIGPYAESHDPSLSLNSTNATKALDESFRYMSDYQVTECHGFDPADTDAIKSAILQYGAITVSYLHIDEYLNGDAYYYPNASGTNHTISVIGWDDNYSKTNFSITPDTDGAWLCRNSWGNYFGNDGYFYISYSEPEICDFYTIKAVPDDTYSKVYGYDGACTNLYNRKDGYSIANIFTAESSDPVTAAAFYTIDEGVSYTLKVYTDVTDDDPESGVLKSVKSGTIDNSGYHTIDLTTPVPVTKGTKFSVVLETSDTAQYADNSNTSAGRSFIKRTPTSTWQDTYNINSSYSCDLYDKGTHFEHPGKYNVCLRALTGKASAVKPNAPTNLSAIPGDGKALLFWDPVANAEQYTVYYYDDQSGSGYVKIGTVTDAFRIMNSLTNDHPYTFAVTATVNGVESTLSPPVTVTAAAGAEIIKIPTGLKGVSGDGKAELSWNSISGAKYYKVYYSTTDNRYFSELYSSPATNSCTVSGLSNGTAYYFWVSAYYANGEESLTSDSVSVTPGSDSSITITSHPSSMTIIGGTVFTMSARADGTGLSFVWEYNDGSSWKELPASSNISQSSGSTMSSIKIYNTTEFNNSDFRCVVYNSSGSSVQTNTATLTFRSEDNVTVSMVENLDSSSLVNYVNYFTSLNSAQLTEAEFRAIELVLENDYKN